MRIARLSLLLLVVLALGCKKDTIPNNGGSSFSIRATIDGKQQTFDVNAKATIDTLGPLYRIIITGQAAAEFNTSIFTIKTQPSRDRVAESVYTNTTGNINLQVVINMSYRDSNLTYETDYSGAGINTATLTITSLTSTHVKGTFSGIAPLLSGTGPSTRSVTNGEFDMDLTY